METKDIKGQAVDVLGFIIGYQSKHRCSPTLSEIVEGLNLKGKSSAQSAVNSLINKGVLERHNKKIPIIISLPPYHG